MSLKHAILGLLTFEPMSGYTLKTRYFDKSIAYFWPADQAQIYRTLQSLEGDRLATSAEVSSDTRPSQRQYTITDDGRQELRDWLTKALPSKPFRYDFLVQLYFSRLVERGQLLELLRERRQRHKDTLQHFEGLCLQEGATPEMKRQIAFGRFTLDFGRRQEVMQIEWLDSVIAEVESWEE